AFSALAINVASNWVLIPRWGIGGAAVSTAISYSVAACILLVVFVRDSGYGVAETLILRRSDVDALRRLVARRWAREGGGRLRARPIPDTAPDRRSSAGQA